MCEGDEDLLALLELLEACEIGIHYPLHVLNRYSLPELIALVDSALQLMGPLGFCQIWTNDNLEYRSVLATVGGDRRALACEARHRCHLPPFRN